jgi:hypothetical protein
MKHARGRTVAAIVTASLLVLVGCSSKKEPPGATGTTSPTASTPGGTTAASPTTGASGQPGAGSTTGGGTATTGPGVATPPPGAKPFVARPAGTYTFETSGQTQLSGAIKRTYQMPPRTTLAVGAASGGVQRSVRDMRDGNGNGRVTETRVRSSSDGLHLVYLKNTTRFAGITDVREFTPNPPPLILRTGAPNGDRLTFTMEGSDVEVTTTVEVLRRESISIGGTSLTAVVIRIVSRFSGSVSGTDTAINWIRPSDGLLLREEDHADLQAGFTRVRTDYKAKLERLTPS